MPLRETEDRTPALPSSDNRLAARSARQPSWPGAVNRLWSRRRRIAMWVLAGMVVSGFLAWRIGRFQAAVQLMPPDSPSGMAGLLPLLSRTSGASPAMLGLAGDFMGLRSTTGLYAKVLQSRTVEDNLVDRFDLRKVYGRKYKIDASRQLEEATTIGEDKPSGVLTLIVKDRDPARARDLANAYVDQLNIVLTKTSTSSARREREFIEQRLTEERQTLAESQQKLSQFSSGTMALDVPEQVKITVESAARLQGELIAARSELDGLEQIYTPDNVRVKSARARVGALEQALRKINAGATPSPNSQDPTFPYPSVKALPTLGVQWANLYRDVKIQETVFEMLTTQYESARIQEAKEIPVAKVLDAAVLPEKRYPRPVWVVLIGTLVSFVLACTGVLMKDAWEAWDESDPRRILLSNMYFGTRNGLNSVWSVFRGGRAGREPQ
jgi:uncharacterized protein involved in exopolysaccharide biosynthesis